MYINLILSCVSVYLLLNMCKYYIRIINEIGLLICKILFIDKNVSIYN